MFGRIECMKQVLLQGELENAYLGFRLLGTHRKKYEAQAGLGGLAVV